MTSNITRLYANNYRCFVGFELRLTPRALLLGYNGVGKSAVFDVLAAIQDLVVLGSDVTDAFPPETLCKFGGSGDQRFELDVESEWGLFRYALHLVHDERRATVAVATEEVTLGEKPLYQFKDSEVQLYRDNHTPAKETFPFAPNRSFLAFLEPKPMNTRVTWFKRFLQKIFVLRLNPSAMTLLASEGDPFLARDGSNFASWCTHLLTQEPDTVARANVVLQGIIPGFGHLRSPSYGRSKVLQAKFRYPGGDDYDLDFDALSDGQRALIALYTITFAVAPYVGVLCLDEPDNFLSIRELQPFLVELDGLAESGGVQALLISHSSEVIDHIGASGALLLERPEGAQTRVGSLASPGGLRLSELMARGWHGPS